MSLRLRRGTDVERQSVVFAEGELVYTTDLKELYIGDGNTLGGIKITGSVDETPIALTRDLDLNSFDIVGSGDIDINGAVTANIFYGSGAQLTELPLLDVNNGAAYQIDIVGADSSIIVNSNTSELYGSFFGRLSGPVYDTNNNILVDNVLGSFNGSFNGLFVGDFQGNSKGMFLGNDSSIMVNSDNSTFTGNFVGDAAGLTNFPADVGVVPGGNYNINIVGDDSTIIINSLNNSLTTNNIYHSDNVLSIKNSNNLLRSVVEVESVDELARLVIVRSSTSIVDDTMVYGRLDFKKDDPNGNFVMGAIGADNLGLFFTYSPSGIGETESNYVTFSANSNFGIGTWTPTEKLDVRGNASITGYTQFGSLSTVDRDSISAANGMVIYNSTENRFQGYQNNAWINLDDGSVA